ncbi:hypothetical protein [Pseudomonas sp. NPDC090201]|uniref:hypothetical protein n=1 Tax=Pseudomonas sp. NPDC090201 TaxID=3364475 RepID=UPI0037FC33BD
MAKFHVDAIQHWESFEHAGTSYDLGHLDCHEVLLRKEAGKDPIRFVVTYGLHCFTKDDTEQNIPLKYADGRESRLVCIERYETSRQLRSALEKLAGATVYLTQDESFFTMDVMNNASGEVEPSRSAWLFFEKTGFCGSMSPAHFLRGQVKVRLGYRSEEKVSASSRSQSTLS